MRAKEIKVNLVDGANGGKMNRFQPGQSGNLLGPPMGPKKKTILKRLMKIKVKSTDSLVAVMKEEFPEMFENKEEHTIQELIAMRLVLTAIAGKDPVPAAKEILNRVEGKVSQTNFKIKPSAATIHVDQLPSALRQQLIEHMEKMDIENIDFEERV